MQNVEKDFWVCWVLDVLFNGMGEGHPRLLFKGGTSLSKAYQVIRRFSEDVDLTYDIRAIAADLGLLDFDPLTAKPSAPWAGARPAALAAVSDTIWRSHGDTVERLELLAAELRDDVDPARAGIQRVLKHRH